MITALGLGLLLGVSAGMAPGPLLALVLSQTLRFGAGAGIRVAAAPLITDLPIVVGAVLLVGAAPTSGPFPAAIALAGAVFVAYLAVDTWRSELEEEGLASRAPRSWTRGVIVNFLSPHPYLFWLTVGAPTLLAAWASDGAVGAAGFIGGFYGGLVGAKMIVALATSRARGFVSGRGYRLVMRGLAVLLALFALGLAREAVAIVAG